MPFPVRSRPRIDGLYRAAVSKIFIQNADIRSSHHGIDRPIQAVVQTGYRIISAPSPDCNLRHTLNSGFPAAGYCQSLFHLLTCRYADNINTAGTSSDFGVPIAAAPIFTETGRAVLYRHTRRF